MNKPLISVIIPVYNMEKYLQVCLDSILKQTHENLEVILVDDGSLDRSPQICDEYCSKDIRVKVIHKENGGQGSARNLALDIMTGDYVSFIDSDDWIECDMYEKMLSLTRENDTDMVQCGNFQVTDMETPVQKNVDETVNIYDRVSAMRAHLNGFITQGPCNKLYKRKLWDNIKFPSNRLLEDAATIYRIIDKTAKIVVTTEKMYYVRCDMNSVSRRKFNVRRYDAYTTYREMEVFLRNHDEYTALVPLVIEKRVGTLFYLLGELYKNKMMKEHAGLVEQLIDNCKECKTKTPPLTFKQRILIELILMNPSLFGFIYKRTK